MKRETNVLPAVDLLYLILLYYKLAHTASHSKKAGAALLKQECIAEIQNTTLYTFDSINATPKERSTQDLPSDRYLQKEGRREAMLCPRKFPRSERKAISTSAREKFDRKGGSKNIKVGLYVPCRDKAIQCFNGGGSEHFAFFLQVPRQLRWVVVSDHVAVTKRVTGAVEKVSSHLQRHVSWRREGYLSMKPTKETKRSRTT